MSRKHTTLHHIPPHQLHHTTPNHTTPHHTTPHHTTPHHTTPHHTTSHHIPPHQPHRTHQTTPVAACVEATGGGSAGWRCETAVQRSATDWPASVSLCGAAPGGGLRVCTVVNKHAATSQKLHPHLQLQPPPSSQPYYITNNNLNHTKKVMQITPE